MPPKKKSSQKKTEKAKFKKVEQKKEKKSKKSDIKTDDDIDDEDIDDELIDEGEELVDNEEFFDEKNFENFNPQIKFHVFDPDKYKTELHKEITIIPNQYRKTSEVITKFEFTEVTSNRAKQIENGSKIFTDIGDEDDPIKMAEMEIKMKQCPLAVRRLISTNIAEIWDVNEMIIPYLT